MAMGKAKLEPWQIRYLFGGDLLAQLIATAFASDGSELPTFGLYGACSTCGEALTLAAMTVAGGYADYAAAVTSSHFGSAEKEFRFPLGYGNQRPLSATWTVTGSGAFLLSDKGGHVKVTGVTPGKIIDMGVKDNMNMGACMAPAACDTIYQNLMDFNRQPEDYDRIITGDLGTVGQTILIELLREKGFDISEVHMDCGIEIYDSERQDTHAGGSGCGCAAVTLSAMILPRIRKGIWKRVLFVPTGALLSKVSFNEGKTIPGIAHGVVLEQC
jgi:stage V sporulation protein AD